MKKEKVIKTFKDKKSTGKDITKALAEYWKTDRDKVLDTFFP